MSIKKQFSSFRRVASGNAPFALAATLVALSVKPAASKTDFNRDIRPFVSNTCFVCHGPDEAKRKAKLRMDVREDAIARGAIVPGKPEQSEAYKRIATKNADDVMPPRGFSHQLTPEQIATFKQWIIEGAEYKKHWAYEKPQRPTPPTSKDKNWPHNPIDNFILARLEQAGITPQPEADKYALARRAALDLTGLPPTPQAADAFVANKAPDAYEKYVDALLASPAYGEHQARQWLDLARYADSAGYADDPSRTIWAYRDYVIKSFNDNKPFDRFTIEQIAGDLLPDATDEQITATAFHRNTMTNNEGGTDDEEFRNAAVIDRVNTTMAVWMGTSMSCAQCHTHKYDPITQKEYFQVFAFFNQSADADRRDESPLLSVQTADQKAQRAQWENEIAAINAKFDAPSPETIAAARKWADNFPVNLDWKPLAPASLQSASGAALEQKDGVISAPQGAKTDTFTLETPLNGGKISALRLETLPSTNFVVTKISAALLPPAAAPAPKARFVRLELPGAGKILQIAEVQVFSGGENLALRGEAKQSSTYTDAEAKRAIDGNTAGEYAKNSVAHTGDGDANPWWEVDLKSEVPIDRVVVWNRFELPERMQGFRLVALDAQRKTVWEKTHNAAPTLSTTFAASGARDVKFATAFADFTQPEFDARDVVTVNPKKTDKTRGWAVGGAPDKPHWLSLLTETPLDVPENSRLRVVIEQESPFEKHTLTRFRLAQSADPRVAENIRTPADVLQILNIAEAQRDAKQKSRLVAHYAREVGPEFREARVRLVTLNKQIEDLKPVTVPIMRDLPTDKRRKTQIQLRGNFLVKGEEVSEGVPSAFSALPDGPKNRLALAKWLVDENNPLTARVVANRHWESIFGTGLVATTEEFGSQGEWPVNPQLLDWLATELVRLKWDNKAFLKMLVTSAAYRQSAKVTPQLLEKDPDNRLVSRGPRFRMSAETVRDQALFAAGLLSPKMYGPSVRPLRPNMGLSAAFGGGLDWQTSGGEDRFRRALYTEWRRTSPYPSLSTFDAPNREVCTLRRARTNTPLQALVTLNDPVYIEAAQALARRIAAQPGSNAEKAAFAFRECLTRPARDGEIQRLLKLHGEVLETYKADAKKAADMATNPIGPAPQGADIANLAAWTTVANVLLNLDETLMKR